MVLDPLTLQTPFAIPTLHVADIELPRELEGLYKLAYNLWWCWAPEARELFASIDPESWAYYRNPVQLLINIEPRHWHSLLASETFRARYRRVTEELARYLRGSQTAWFHEHHGDGQLGQVAYFSMEYGIHESLALYSGGLGVLSGDHCKSASDLGLPFIALGLLYRHGYFRQTIDADGLQQHTYPEYDFTRLPMRPVAGATGRELLVTVPLPGRQLTVRLWLAQVGRVPLLLLDTDIPENDPADRPITNLLYVSGREMRLLQELVLGIGGVRALAALGVEPTVWHLNEGHSVFLQLERLRERVRRDGLPWREALDGLALNTVFTTHTPVPAGNEQFEPELVQKYLQGWCDEVGCSFDELLQMGRARDQETNFNLTALAVRTSSFVNGVSQVNARVASDMWRHLLPRAKDDLPVVAITNGVHVPTWMGREMRELLVRYLGPGWEALLLEPDAWKKLYEIADEDLWAAHRAQKERLGRFTSSRLREQLARHGSSPDVLRAVAGLFRSDALTIGFARRFATYKRANLIFSDLARLEALVANRDRPVQLIFAGKAHPADRPGQELIQRIFQLSRSDRLTGKVFFLENYDIRVGHMLVQGVDVWLNTPRRPLEASGTSGQKAAQNGALNLSIQDGWWPEGYNGENGWVFGNGLEIEDVAEDKADAESLYRTLESIVVPLFYERDAADLPRAWLQKMKSAIATLTPRFSASRMVRDYVEKAYVPAARRLGDAP